MKNPAYYLRALALFILLAFLAACASLQFGIESPTPPIMGSSTPSGASLETPVSTPTGEGQPSATPAGNDLPTAVPQSPGESILRVAYIKDGNVHLWTQERGAVVLTSSGNATEVKISDDGLVAAFIRQLDDFHAELWAVNTNGSSERRLVSAADLDALYSQDRQPFTMGIVPHQFQWIPRKKALAFNTRPTFEGPGLSLNDDLHLVDSITYEQTTLLPKGQGGMFYYAPDGSQIAIVTPTQISLVNMDGSNRRQVLDYEPVTTYSEYFFYAHPNWSPDSSYMLVSIPPEDPLAEPRQPTTLWQASNDGSAAIQLGMVLAMPFFGGGVEFSSDLSKLAYLSETGEPQQNLRELHIAEVDSSDDFIYHTDQLIEFLGWAPDSTHFVFATGQDRVLQLGQVGAGFQPLTDDPTAIIGITWVDAESFLLLKETSGAWELRLYDLQGAMTMIDTVEGHPNTFDFDL